MQRGTEEACQAAPGQTARAVACHVRAVVGSLPGGHGWSTCFFRLRYSACGAGACGGWVLFGIFSRIPNKGMSYGYAAAAVTSGPTVTATNLSTASRLAASIHVMLLLYSTVAASKRRGETAANRALQGLQVSVFSHLRSPHGSPSARAQVKRATRHGTGGTPDIAHWGLIGRPRGRSIPLTITFRSRSACGSAQFDRAGSHHDSTQKLSQASSIRRGGRHSRGHTRWRRRTLEVGQYHRSCQPRSSRRGPT